MSQPQFARPDEISARDRAALDHPIWTALTTGHESLAEGGAIARRYPAAFAPFAAMRETTADAFEALAPLVPVGGRIALFTIEPITPPPIFTVQLATTGYQMMATALPDVTTDAEIITLGAADVPEMLGLVELTKPGPFSQRTHELGTYIGIRVDGELAAMVGERMKIDRYTEISAVAVHPAHRGKGYAQILISAIAKTIARRGFHPMLHVFADNAPAIALYERLGFLTRCRVHVTGLIRT